MKKCPISERNCFNLCHFQAKTSPNPNPSESSCERVPPTPRSNPGLKVFKLNKPAELPTGTDTGHRTGTVLRLKPQFTMGATWALGTRMLGRGFHLWRMRVKLEKVEMGRRTFLTTVKFVDFLVSLSLYSRTLCATTVLTTY